jgi:hypothetical protein
MSFGTEQAVQGAHGMNLNPSLSRVEIPQVLDKVNAILSSVCLQHFINPYTAVLKIKNFLSQIGIVFDTPLLIGDEGGVTMDAKQYPIYSSDNHCGDLGTENIPGGLSIRFNWCKIKGIYVLEVELKRRMDSSLPHITEPIHEKWTFAGKLRKERSRVRKYRVGKSYKRKYTKHKYGVSTPKGFSHKKIKPIKKVKPVTVK